MAIFIQKLTNLLVREFPRCEVELENVGGNRVGGFLIWKGFSRLDQIDRQRKLSSVLKKKLPQAEQLRISAILTMTPEEMASAREG
ncbi:MAG: hypothetical protein ABSH08_01750 [Tepidisphaeraceae bacterium]|jgi:hypothetical protein